ncbi:DUF6252 family protein [Algoriphagus marincola]|uniref:DUF6252 family protein n=1 Tax=Algoriphagus marincola TaxID=264027 RepID=UPI000420CA53|nr:DUF6252 family protein [Algoriphagus marincola]
MSKLIRAFVVWTLGFDSSNFEIKTMENFQKLLFAFSFILLISSCGEDDDMSPVAGDCPAGKICFKLNGSDTQVDAVWFDINGQRTRVYYENGSGTSYENIEIDFYGTAPGSYPIVGQNWSSGDASFQYFKASGSGGASGNSGTVEITEVGSTVSGTFSVSGTDAQGNSVQITDGVINRVPAD